MPPKAKIPAPIDRPLSRAYLREFSGWSSAYPPGLSDPTSLRVMENVQINRDGSARVRPGLRYLSYAQPPTDTLGGTAIDAELVGSHEAFYLNDGTKAYLFAVRESDQTVGFRVLVFDVAGTVVRHLTDGGVEFDIPQGESALRFSAATTYVKYLQIDNKIFALSNAGEPLRLFNVGAAKQAKTLASISRPAWDTNDKLKVVHPDAHWITDLLITDVRVNRLLNPSFETNLRSWELSGYTSAELSTAVTAKSGYKTVALQSLPQRTNLCRQPLHDMGTYGYLGWIAHTWNQPALSIDGAYLRVTSQNKAGTYYVKSPTQYVEAGERYKVAFDVDWSAGVSPQVLFRFYGANGAQVGVDTLQSISSGGRWSSAAVTAPAGAVTLLAFVGGANASATITYVKLKNVVVCEASQSTAAFHGSSGANYFWTGSPGASESVYHPPVAVMMTSSAMPMAPAVELCCSIHTQAASTARASRVLVATYNAADELLALTAGSDVTDTAGSWARPYKHLGSTGSSAVKVRMSVQIDALARGEIHYVDAGLVETDTATPDTYFDGSTPDTSTVTNMWGLDGSSPHNNVSVQTTVTAPTAIPAAETKTAETLISNDRVDNQYSFGFFYTMSNEIGESAASPITVVRTQRGWASWVWETPNVSGEPSGTDTSDPEMCTDQLVAIMPQAVFDIALAEGATSWTLYMFTWSDQDAVPVTAIKVGKRVLNATSTRALDGWIRVTPVTGRTGDEVAQLPTAANRFNYSNPTRAGQGLVAADRMVVVLDPTEPARIRWTSNQQGEYSNFSAAKGGGYKTLTSGNLFVPACVKLWQNPQSVDTLTVLCLGTDGHSASYYMAPAEVSSQSSSVALMGFEETTSTPGTTSPYGCEVFNNALYHPLEDQLMKSTAMNYNINHKSQTDQISDVWADLIDKQHIVSSQLDARLYYLVHNPAGASLEDGCQGNEVWVLDAGAKSGTWSRWLVQGASLRKIEFGGKVFMSVVRPDGLFYFDPDYGMDDWVNDELGVQARGIPWKLETNTQGANRAHDANCRLQQANVVLGNFQGTLRYGVRAWDLNGRPIQVDKLVSDVNPPDDLAYDLDDYLLIRADLREWFFFAESVVDDGGATVPSRGQINLVQYRYTPLSVNTGYEYGSVETFEYGRAAEGGDSYTTNGIPVPAIDTRRP